MRVLLLALALAACSAPADKQQSPAPEAPAVEENTAQAAQAQMPSWQEARAAGVDFRGIGQEPGWMIDIYRDTRIRVLLDYGETRIDFPLTAPTYPVEGTTRYDTHMNGRTLAVTIRRFPCQDAMSGENYPSTVEILIDGRTLNGCGRSV